MSFLSNWMKILVLICGTILIWTAIVATRYNVQERFDIHIGEKLDNMLLEIEELSLNSGYPEKINSKWLSNFILGCYQQ